MRWECEDSMLILGKIQTSQFITGQIGELLLQSYQLPAASPAYISNQSYNFLALDSYTIKNFRLRKKRKRHWRRNWKFWYIEKKSGSRWLVNGAPNQRKRNCQSESTKAFQTKCVSWPIKFAILERNVLECKRNFNKLLEFWLKISWKSMITYHLVFSFFLYWKR